MLLLAVAVVAALVWTLATGRDGEDGAADARASESADLAAVNTLRIDAGSPPVARDAALDALAQVLLEAAFAQECLCAGELLASIERPTLTNGSDDGSNAVSVAIGWSLDAPGAARAAVGARAHRSMLTDDRWTQAGLASALVPVDSDWLVEFASAATPASPTSTSADTPPYADARYLGLAGYTVAVVVFRADDVAGR